MEIGFFQLNWNFLGSTRNDACGELNVVTQSMPIESYLSTLLMIIQTATSFYGQLMWSYV